MLKFAFHNLGCKVNAYETDAMIQLLKNAGFEQVDFKEDNADIYIVNTCSVTNIADRKSRQMLHRAKTSNPNSIVVATGCYVQAQGDNQEEVVDIVIGNNKKGEIVQIIADYMKERHQTIEISDISKENNYEDLFVTDVSEHTRAYIKIQDGCNQFCSYCIIPYVRGRVRSRDIESILVEIGQLTMKGFKEFVLTGIHLSSYGVEWESPKLLEVIKEVAKITGVERIRLGSLEPRIVTEEFASELSKIEKVCPHFHLSLQSGCDETLKRMNRRYDADEYYEKCCILRKYFDNPAITTDVIVGFPGETEEEFSKTFDYLKKVKFFEMHVFKYSRRKGTVADKLPNQIKDQVKTERSQKLIELDELMSSEYRTSQIGKTHEVLIEEIVQIDSTNYALGHTKTYIKVLIEVNDINVLKPNTIVKATITGAADKDRMFASI